MGTPAADSAGRARPAADGESDALRRELDAVAREASWLRREASLAKADSLRSARALLDVETRLAFANARIAALEQLVADRSSAVGALSSRLDRAERVSAGVQASLSWRVTAPLRSLKRRL